MAREEVERSQHFMLKIVVMDDMGDALVATVAEERVATAKEANVDAEVVVAGRRKPIFPPDHILTRSGIFLAMMRRARYFLSAIKLNYARSMGLRYRRSIANISNIADGQNAGLSAAD